MNAFDLEIMYPTQARQAISNFGSDATTVSSLIEELATNDCSVEELENQIADEIWNFVERAEQRYHSGV